jgi:hypothetical protein
VWVVRWICCASATSDEVFLPFTPDPDEFG